MVLGTQRTIEATDLWELEPQFASAELLSNRLNDIWNRRQAEAAAYNARLANGEIKAGIWPRLKWTLGRGNEETWRQNARKRASLVWTCNELVGSLGKARDASESDMSLNWWWIGCAYKRMSCVSFSALIAADLGPRTSLRRLESDDVPTRDSLPHQLRAEV